MTKLNSPILKNTEKRWQHTVSFKSMISLLSCLLFFLLSCKPDVTNKSTVTKKTIKNKEPLCWKDLRYGELPPVGAYDGIDSLVKKWNLCYERIEAGCEITDSIQDLKNQYEASNAIYFKNLEARLGKDWKRVFDKELQVADSINWIKIKQEINRLNP